MTQPAYFNVHGQPLAVSARDAVLAREPLAYSQDRSGSLVTARGKPFPLWRISRARADGKQRRSDTWLGDGATEEAAWLAALSRMRLQDNEAAE